jgi:hypothetical protein
VATTSHTYPLISGFTIFVLRNHAKLKSIWWYYGPEHSQHIAFFTRTALQQLAARFRANYYTNGDSIHLISRRHISEEVFRLVLHPKVCAFVNHLYCRKSLLDEDFAVAMRQAKEEAEQLTRSYKLQDQT